MKRNKTKTAAIVIAIATAIALSGTFAWQSISQMVLNEAIKSANPGGRLHDDFSGYKATDTKDIYVENFGDEPIYARVRLDEYMEIGEGAGLKGTVGEDGTVTPNPENQAVPLVATAKLEDMSTWTTHIPDDDPAVGTETDFTDPDITFHTYWTWTMGGQAEDNPDGKTVYMPTFNKNKDSLKADINGTLAGLDKDPTTGEEYDDYHEYTVGESAIRVRDEDTDTYPDGATYDIDPDTTDECGPYGGAGGAGVEGVNYGMKEETHKARETMKSSVITMTEYKRKSPEDKAAFVGWVYDADGWAYWSQPIEPGTPTETDEFVTNATGLLLDRIVPEQRPANAWYYSINAVSQFITADDLGRTTEPKSGFYADGAPPTEDALDLLEGIGVNTAGVKGAITLSASATVGGEVKYFAYAVQGMDLDLSSVVTVADADSPVQDITWSVSGNTDLGTTIDYSTAKPVLKVGSNEEAGNILTITAASSHPAYDRLKGKIKLVVRPLEYTVTVTPDGGAASVLPNATQGFTAKLTSNDPTHTLPQNFTWSLVGNRVSSITPAGDSGKATLTVAKLETAENITVKATPKDAAAYPGVSGTATISITPVTFTVDILDSENASVKGGTVTIKDGQSATFTKVVTSDPADQTPTDHWTWSSSDTTRKITVDQTGKVSTAIGTPTGATATITVSNGDYTPALEASFTVTAQLRRYSVTVSPGTVTVYPRKTQAFTATVTADEGSDPPDTVSWSVSGNSDAKTKFNGSTLTVGTDETATKLTVTATHTATGTTGTATVTVGKPTFTVDIKQGSTSVKGKTVEIRYGDSATYTLAITSNPTGYTPDGTWNWTSSDTSGKITVSSGTVTVASNATVGSTATIKATNSVNSSLTASFTVKVRALAVSETLKIDNVDFIVLVPNAKITGTDGRRYNAALLLKKNSTTREVFGSSNKWKDSAIRKTLNGSYLSDHPTINSKAIQVTIYTRKEHNQAVSDGGVPCKVFYLSEADVYGTSNNGQDTSPQNWEYTYNNSQLPYPPTGTTSNGWDFRSPANSTTDVGCIYRDGEQGKWPCTDDGGSRPAFWYNLD